MLTVLALACSRSGLIVALRPRTGPDCSARASRRRLASAATFQTADTISPCRCPEVRGGVCASTVVVRMCACTLCWSSFGCVCSVCERLLCALCGAGRSVGKSCEPRWPAPGPHSRPWKFARKGTVLAARTQRKHREKAASYPP